MKLRIHGNTIRFRLTQTEVQQLAQGQPVEEHTLIAPQPLIYRIAPAKVPHIQATFDGGVLTVQARSDKLKIWASGDEVGIDGNIKTPSGPDLQIAIEKDFQCLHGSPNGQEDCYPNPKASKPAGA